MTIESSECLAVGGCHFADECHGVGCREAITVGEDPESVLQEAQRLVYGDRAADYGGALEEAEKVAAGWSVITGALIEPEMYPLCMAWLKIVRQTNRAKRDNLVDLAGYAGVAEKIDKDRGEVN